MEIKYVIGDATRPQEEGPAVIAHICNDIGGWGAGFVLAVSSRWPEPQQQYHEWHRGRDPRGAPFELGQAQFVRVEPDLWVANMIGQHGVASEKGRPPIRYDALREALGRVAEFARAHRASVHMPRIGCGLAGGRWEEVGPLVQAELADKGIPVTVYDRQ